MNRRIVLACCTAVLFSLSLVLGQSKNDCTGKCPAMSSASCCMHGSKASMTSAAKTSNGARIVAVKDGGAKECPMKGVKNANDCTTADKANCNMAKMSMTKASTKAGCCTMKAKGAEAKNS